MKEDKIKHENKYICGVIYRVTRVGQQYMQHSCRANSLVKFQFLAWTASFCKLRNIFFSFLCSHYIVNIFLITLTWPRLPLLSALGYSCLILVTQLILFNYQISLFYCWLGNLIKVPVMLFHALRVQYRTFSLSFSFLKLMKVASFIGSKFMDQMFLN